MDALTGDVHGTTREQPLVAFQQREQPRLLPLPPAPWELVTWTAAVVHPDCHLYVARAGYSVPHALVGRRLDVCRFTADTAPRICGQAAPALRGEDAPG